jgi:hypothetical protein
MLYVASFGPACCLADRGYLSADEASTAHTQIVRAMMEGPPWLRESILACASVCGGEETATEVFLASVEFEAHYSDYANEWAEPELVDLTAGYPDRARKI